MKAMMTVDKHWLGQGMSLSASRSAIPRDLARSMVFSSLPANAKRVRYTDKALLAEWPDRGVAIYQRTGVQLTQTEETVWLQLVRLAINGKEPLGKRQTKVPVAFTANGLLRALGKQPERKNRQDLLAAIERIGDARIQVVVAGKNLYAGNLLDVSAMQRTADHGYVVNLDMLLAKLFASGWSLINLDQRHALRADPLAQWLHTYYSTHAKPMRRSQAKLKKECGRSHSREADWLKSLEAALKALQAATGWACTLASDGNVYVVKPAKTKEKEAAGDLSAADVLILDAWMRTLNQRQLITELAKHGYELKKYSITSAPELREQLMSIYKAQPGRCAKRLAKLRPATVVTEEDI